jgi:hypothetical protein
MGVLNADAIRSADDLVYETVTVPEWGGDVIIRGLTAKERDAYDREIVSVDERGRTKLGRLENLRALLLVRCMVDEKHERLYRDADARMLGDKSSKVIGELYSIAARLSGMRDDVVEEEAEDFAEGQPDDNSSESPSRLVSLSESS